ncbi:FABP family protein [Spiractinospora alimapuensis]|uniref:FABP family protein n=1 Tax=Spiractinospora alimapuensis TaxID=2820884 RepID=UPI001F2A85F0|nr:FABP family protein [Spiractinospora alimapuensis]QVQ50785.1 FABP family protein [Spiractinospora alimapuensis]
MGDESRTGLDRLSFLVGRWEGVGVTDFPDGEEQQFGQEVEFIRRTDSYLEYRATAWRLNADGTPATTLTSESGYWRARPDAERAAEENDGEPAPHVEALFVHPEGFTELYYGTVFANRIELVTDAVLRSDTAGEVAGGHRLYGLIGADRAALGYAWDLHGGEGKRQMSAQLKRA